jgi:sugar phosphate isomerase/epimerase
MEPGLSTYLFQNRRLSSHFLDQIREAGIRKLEIFAAREHLDYHDKRHVRDIAEWFADHEMALHSVHMPLFSGFGGQRAGALALSPAYTEKRLRIGSMDEIKRAIEIAEHLPFRFIILHLGLPGDSYDMRKLDAAFSSIEHLRLFAKERAVDVLIENTPGALSTPERVMYFIQYTRLDVKVCFDAGHAHLAGGVQPSLELLKSHVAAVHLHDNRGENDDHLLPFGGTIQWKEAIESFHTLDPNTAFLLEPRDYGTEKADMSQIQEVIRRIREM